MSHQPQHPLNTKVHRLRVVPERVTRSQPLSNLAEDIIIARELIQLGAKSGLVVQLTQLTKNIANRLYREINGFSSPSGQSRYTSGWYERDPHRMLEASFVSLYFTGMRNADISESDKLVAIYKIYIQYFKSPRLTITHVSDIVKLMASDALRHRRCSKCRSRYLTSVCDQKRFGICPGCELHVLYHCAQCGSVMRQNDSGGRKKRCTACQGRKKTPSTAPVSH